MSQWSVQRTRPETEQANQDPDQGGRRQFVIDDSLGYLVNRAARLMAQQLADALRPDGVGIGQWAVLLHLWAADDMSQAELSRVVAIEPPTMVRTIDRMARDGLVERRPDERDARVSRIHLTERGRSIRDQLVVKAAGVNERTLARLSASERKTLVRLLKKLIATDGQGGPA